MLDLEHLELVYTPPYVSVKDPANMTGFVGSNILRGDVDIIRAEDLEIGEDDLQIVDVRSLREVSKGCIPTTVNIPLKKLWFRVVLYCQVGYRGYLAYRILKRRS